MKTRAINTVLIVAAVFICAAALIVTSGADGVKSYAAEEPEAITAEDMDEIASALDPETVTEVTETLGSATPDEYIQAFMEADPESVEIIENILEED